MKKVRGGVDFWTRDEFERVAATFDVGDYVQLAEFTWLWSLYMTGLRIGEFQALGWRGGVDFPGRAVDVRGSMFYRNAHDWRIGPPKTPAAVRRVPLDSLTLRYLERWRDAQAASCPGVARFVCSLDGLTPATKCTMAKVIARHADAAGVKRVRVHDLRHSHVSLLISLGENPLAICDRVGHEDVKTTLGTYGHLMQNANYQVADRLDAAFGGACDEEGSGYVEGAGAE